jgi:L-lactate dehydrogenase
MKKRVAIVGTGWVGSSVAISTLHSGVANELLLCDLRADLAEGEAMDLAQGAAFYPTAQVRAAGLDELAGAAAIVIAAGRGGRPDESRLDLLRDNAQVIRTLGRRLTGYGGVIVMVTNPVDVLTHVMTEASGLPPSRVIGTGTMLDSVRLRQVIARLIGIHAHSVHAHVVGEHGDSEVVLWSAARAGGLQLREWPAWDAAREQEVADEVRRAAYEIIRRKGATYHAIGLVTADLLRSLLRDERRVLTVSRVQEGAGGLHGVALSLPSVVGAQGAVDIIPPAMSGEERQRLEASAGVLRAALASLRDQM